MTHLPYTLLAYFLNAAAVTVDKFLLTKSIPNPLTYIFYISLASLLALFLLPFTHIPSLKVLLLASSSTILWTTGAYFLYKALQVGLASRVIPVIGTLIPLILFVHARAFNSITTTQTWAIQILILGIIFLTLPEWRGRMKKVELLFELISAILFAISYLVLKEAYLKEQFLTVLVWSRLVLIPAGLFMLLWPSLRKIVLASEGPRPKLFSKIWGLFVLGQFAGGFSEILLTFSISLASPALVNSLQGTQYIFLLLFSWVLTKKYPAIFEEKLTFPTMTSKFLGILLVGTGIYLLAIYGQ